MALNTYLSDVANLLHDPNNLFWNTTLLTAYINESRSVIATESECVRRLVPVSTVVSQEAYNFPSAIDTSNGIRDAVDVKSIAVNWGGVGGSSKPMLARLDWTFFQAYYRYYGGNLQGNPESFAIGPFQVGDTFSGTIGPGMSGKVYLGPIPTSILPSEWDCVCNVTDLASDSDPEPIPYPYYRIVKYYAAYLAFINAQRKRDADGMLALYRDRLTWANNVRGSTFVPWMYGTG